MSLTKITIATISQNVMQIRQNCEKILASSTKNDEQTQFEHYRHRILANARALLGSQKSLEVVTIGAERAGKIGVALVEYTPDGRSFVHFYFPGQVSRLDSLNQLLVMTEEKLTPCFENLAVTQGWIEPGVGTVQRA
ncbi:uncharacterized protein BDR25DRAFT_67961 [Lindgomyces ingoldianus]|uniref:Uncharacterized protein n=1 Tax=Lindgomyces ingoldianus TaxID=673940 RepID=A0ACB6RD29_9PLEO|nr:uncharacterized protein BDR25DRAFT_67961 [Lindgomyces ingoldianus]KAF2476635.1 hypothetical protein BDR25DRAFT_67961 [Lindgomyces ingoldianus]